MPEMQPQLIHGTEWEEPPTRRKESRQMIGGYNVYDLTDKLVRLRILDAATPQTATPNRDFMQRLRARTLQILKEHPRKTLQNSFTRAIMMEIIAAIPLGTVFREALVIALTDIAYRYIAYGPIEEAKCAETYLPDDHVLQTWLQAWIKGDISAT
jgi:hypothetical protein